MSIARMRPDRIVFVYNADSGLFNSVIGRSHKLLSPATYECSLCRHTFGLSGMLVPWKTFLSMLPFPSEFLHRDGFRSRYPKWANYALHWSKRGSMNGRKSALRDQ